jgi:ABC-type phosphate transport system substrate-binding protein
MSQKNEILPLLLTVTITSAILGGIAWWLINKFDQRSTSSLSSLNELAFQTGEYPITRRLFVIIKQNGQLDEQAGEIYANLLLTNQGQQLIKKAGFVSLR